jgi:hypothetical protein
MQFSESDGGETSRCWHGGAGRLGLTRLGYGSNRVGRRNFLPIFPHGRIADLTPQVESIPAWRNIAAWQHLLSGRAVLKSTPIERSALWFARYCGACEALAWLPVVAIFVDRRCSRTVIWVFAGHDTTCRRSWWVDLIRSADWR